MIVISLLAGLLVPAAMVPADDTPMMLALMTVFPFVGFLVQKHILWRPGRPAFRVRRPDRGA